METNDQQEVGEKVAPKKVRCAWLKKEAVSTDALLIGLSVIFGALVIALTLSLPQMNSGKAADMKKGAVADTAPEAPTGPVTTTLDDDAVMGDATKAKVAIVEFSDLECPFCKRFHDETYDQLVKEYVETGKAVLVARDFPLSFHDPKATEEAAVAECVRDQKDDAAYFSFTKAIYANTLTNGKGLPEGKMMELLKAAGVDSTKALACSEQAATKEEIAKDIADGTKAGVTGTPSFLIGTLDEDGTVTGELVVGALPLAGFQEVVSKYIK
jgi:protein-disulfide isomerase